MGNETKFRKEVKIGLAVVGALVLVLGVVVIRRLCGSSEDAQLACSEDQDQFVAVPKDATTAKEVVKVPATNLSAKSTTLMASNIAIPSVAQSSSDLDAWEMDADKLESKRASSSSIKTAQPSLMPNPSQAYASDSYDRYGSSYADPSSPSSRDLAATQVSQQRNLPRTAEPETSRYTYSTPPQSSDLDRNYAGGSMAGSRVESKSSASLSSSKNTRRTDGKYEVQPNDSYWTISEKLYGSGAYFKALAEANKKKYSNQDSLQVGDLIAAPDVATLEKNYPDLCPKPAHLEAAQKGGISLTGLSRTSALGQTYVVQEGDTLFEIARNVLGKPSRWSEIYDLNRQQLGPDYNYLPPGLRLVLPEKDPPSRVTSKPTIDSTLRR
jgi:nucleoid-associated protein YgaU